MLNSKQKQELLQQIWTTMELEDFNEGDYSIFFEYVDRELALSRQCQSSIGTDSWAPTLSLIQFLHSYSDRPRNEVVNLANADLSETDENTVLRRLELASHLLLTLNIQCRGLPSRGISARPSIVEWDQSTTLQDLIRGKFQVPAADIDVLLHPQLTAANLNTECKVRVLWTDNLADHLILDRKNKTLTVYQHKICIFNHYRSSTSILSPKLLEETIDTFNLLFPWSDQHTQDLLIRERQPFWTLGACDRDRQLALGQYSYWRDRIEELNKLFNEPRDHLLPFLHDRRDMATLTNVWIAILVGVLTIFSLVFGSVSMVYSIKQYNLSLAQACSTEMASNLPQYCGT